MPATRRKWDTGGLRFQLEPPRDTQEAANLSSDDLTVDSILGTDGRISRRLKGYEPRPQQLAMAREVAAALESSQHLVAEAGTGTGKSFAYLVPAILYATGDQTESKTSDSGNHASSENRSGQKKSGERSSSANTDLDDDDDDKPRPRRVLISTHTISLQEQLMSKDIPLLNSVIPREFSAVLVKGRGNYLSLRRLDRAIARSTSLLDSNDQLSQLKQIQAWAKDTSDGSLATLPTKPDSAVWDEVVSDTGNCLRRACPHFNDCFYFRARRRASNAQLMIVNHAMFFSDLALRKEGIALLPNYDAVVLDECHTLESVAGDHLGIRLTNGQFDFLFDRLYNDRTQKGLLVTHNLEELQKLVDRCRYAASNLFADITDWMEEHAKKNCRVYHHDIVDNPLSEPMEQLAKRLLMQAESRKDDSERKDFESAHDRLLVLSGELRKWLKQDLEGGVHWIERSTMRRGGERVTLAASPIDVGHALRQVLFQSDQIKSVVMTSATLATNQTDAFAFFRSRIGLTGGMNIQVGSPFDYAKQAKLVIVRDLPDPSKDKDKFEKALPEQIKRFVGHTAGHAFVLFTSYDLLRRCAEAVSGWLAEQNLALYTQAGTQTRTQLLDAFRRDPNGVLFGTDSFWQGVDVPGDALTNVIITKLPFSVPDHPLLEARLDAIKSRGGNPFSEYQLPEAVIKFRQGFGRLIRTKTDTGIVVVLDPRIQSKPYGRMFRESLPDVQVHYVSSVQRPRRS